MTSLPAPATPIPTNRRGARWPWVAIVSAAGVPLSLLWDYSWESTVGIDRAWAAPHVGTYLSVLLAFLAAMVGTLSTPREMGVGLGRTSAPLGAWFIIWGALAYATAFLFDTWWQASYGLAAGIWHPPQLLKATAFFAIVLGAWIAGARVSQLAFRIGGGVVLALVGVVTLAFNFPNRQHDASFYQLACGPYPVILVALASAGRGRFPATTGALVYMSLHACMVWLLPLLPGSPLVAPIYHPRDHLLPPPFPLLLVAPALAIDLLLRVFPSRERTGENGWRAVETGLAFFVVFIAVQWPFASFLLMPSADHWFFAGGGKHWPFFLKISPSAQTAFWTEPADTLTRARASIAAGCSIAAAGIGLWLGAWLKALRR